MRWFSTRDNSYYTDTKSAIVDGLAPEQGLFMPEVIPSLRSSVLNSLGGMTFQEISFEVARLFFRDDLSDAELHSVVEDAFNFQIPLRSLSERIASLELFHGPTLAFKDVGARFMSRMLRQLHHAGSDNDITILVATSGDTGSAVASGFLGVEGIKVVLLYPAGKVSDFQERQLTTLGDNITALRIDGRFDDCQRLVKTAFADNTTKSRFHLTSANSINIARLIPQSFYYFHAAGQTGKNAIDYCAVPSGNFGNLTAGVFAKRMGLPIKRFLAATNSNRVFYDYLQTGKYEARKSIQTISNAMDVGDPSNFERLLSLYNDSRKAMREDIVSYWVSDNQTRETIASVYDKYGYVLDPHGAVAAYFLLKTLDDDKSNANGIFLECAHPAKFGDVLFETLGFEPEIPEAARHVLESTPVYTDLDSSYESFLQILEDVL